MLQELKLNELTQKIIGCAMTIHRKMRNGYVEAVYGKCLAIEMKKTGVEFVQEGEVPIYYDETIVGKRRGDIIIEQKVMVEIKAMTEITDAHVAQILNYLETHHFEIGLLINFGAKSLQFKRLIHQRKTQHAKNPINPSKSN
ncbi:MAG: GxxExxY protein [Chitinophagaceae bacterium]